jgi:hypothetical protein
MLKKKFKVVIEHIGDGYYEIHYYEYYLIPAVFQILHEFTEYWPSWKVALFTYQKAEELAATFKSVEDVNKWLEPSMALAKRRQEWKEKNSRPIPYQSKTFTYEN